MKYSADADAQLTGDEFSAASIHEADGSSVNSGTYAGRAFVECGRQTMFDGGFSAAQFSLNVAPPLQTLEASDSALKGVNLVFDAMNYAQGVTVEYTCSSQVISASGDPLGTFDVALSSVRKVSDSQMGGYIVHGHAHAVCPGLPSAGVVNPGFITFDVTL